MGFTHSESESDALIPELQSAYCNIRFVFCGHTPHVLQWPFCEGFESLKEGASILTDHKPGRAELQITSLNEQETGIDVPVRTLEPAVKHTLAGGP